MANINADTPVGVRRLSKSISVALVGLLALVMLLLLAAMQQRMRSSTAQDKPNLVARPQADSSAGLAAVLAPYTADKTAKPPPIDEVPLAPMVPEQLAQLVPEDDKAQEMASYYERLLLDALMAGTGLQDNDPAPPWAVDEASPVDDVLGNLAKVLPSISAQRDAELAQLSGALGGAIVANPSRHKEEFVAAKRHIGYSLATRQPPAAEYELKAGSVIPATLMTAINTDLPGIIMAQVSRDVRDTITGDAVLLPVGSRLIGAYDSQVSFGQRRILATWHRVQFPDGSVLALGSMPAIDALGQAGMKARVDNRALQAIGGAAALSVIAALARGSQANINSALSARETLAEELGRQWANVGEDLIGRTLDVQPTLKLRPGYKLRVLVTEDLIIAPYEPWEVGVVDQ